MKIAAALIVTLAVGILVSVVVASTTLARVQAIQEAITGDEIMSDLRDPDFTTTYIDSEGLQHTINTYCHEGQEPGDCAALHRDKVAALKKLFPPKK